MRRLFGFGRLDGRICRRRSRARRRGLRRVRDVDPRRHLSRHPIVVGGDDLHCGASGPRRRALNLASAVAEILERHSLRRRFRDKPQTFAPVIDEGGEFDPIDARRRSLEAGRWTPAARAAAWRRQVRRSLERAARACGLARPPKAPCPAELSSAAVGGGVGGPVVDCNGGCVWAVGPGGSIGGSLTLGLFGAVEPTMD